MKRERRIGKLLEEAKTGKMLEHLPTDLKVALVLWDQIKEQGLPLHPDHWDFVKTLVDECLLPVRPGRPDQPPLWKTKDGIDEAMRAWQSAKTLVWFGNQSYVNATGQRVNSDVN